MEACSNTLFLSWPELQDLDVANPPQTCTAPFKKNEGMKVVLWSRSFPLAEMTVLLTSGLALLFGDEKEKPQPVVKQLHNLFCASDFLALYLSSKSETQIWKLE